MSELRFNHKTWQRLIALSKPFFFSEVKWLARGMIILLAVLSITNSLINVVMSYFNRDFMTALSLKEESEFIRNLSLYLVIFACAIPFIVFYRYTEERLALLWRRWLSQRMLEQYFKNHAYYKINSYPGLDNPDQRIEEDIRSFTSSSLSILMIIFNSIITIFAFMGILWSISLNLVLAVLLYALVGSIIAYVLGRPLIGLNFEQLKREGDYRYKLVNVRDNAESIAFYRDEAKEYTRVRQRLRNALRNLLQIIKWNRNLNFFTTSYNFFIGVLPIMIVAPLYLNGGIEFGVVTQAAGAFVQVVNALSVIVLNFGSLSALTAVITRLGSFQEALEDASRLARPGESNIVIKAAPQVRFENVTILTPNRSQTILSNLSFDLEGKNLFITGASGAGKSSILRAAAGIWTAGSGTIYRPHLDRTVFLPQRPYMILGSFRSQLLYGIHERGVSDRAITRAVELVGLNDTLRRIGGLNTSLDWLNLLSIGEQQRLAFGRLLLARPDFVFLDEATTAIDQDTEKRLYVELKKFAKGYISVGYRDGLRAQHHQVLELSDQGTWKIEEGGA